MEEAARAKGVPFQAFSIKGGDHFNILPPISPLLAKKIMADTGKKCNITLSADELQTAFQNRGR